MKQPKHMDPANGDGFRFLARAIDGEVISELTLSVPQGDAIFGILYNAYSGRKWDEIPSVILDHAQMTGWWRSEVPAEVSASDLEVLLDLLKELNEANVEARYSTLSTDDLVACAKDVYEFLNVNDCSGAKIFIQAIW